MLFSEVNSAISFGKRNLANKLLDARNNLIGNRNAFYFYSLFKKMNFASLFLCFQSIQLFTSMNDYTGCPILGGGKHGDQTDFDNLLLK